MPHMPWLELEDRFLLDGDDFRVITSLMGRTDRLTFQLLLVEPLLGGKGRRLLQLEEGLMEATPISADYLKGEKVRIGDRNFVLDWDDELRIERAAVGSRTRFGRGRCRWFEADDGSVAVLIEDRDGYEALVGVPLARGRYNLSYTEGLR